MFSGKADPARIAKLANYVRRKQLADGGWNIYPGGPSELNATCKAYFALKLVGDNPEIAHTWSQARETGTSSGRPGESNSYVRFYLALTGALGWETGPVDSAGNDAPAELVLSQHLRNVFVDARHRNSHGDSFRAAARTGACPEHARVDELFKDPIAQSGRV